MESISSKLFKMKKKFRIRGMRICKNKRRIRIYRIQIKRLKIYKVNRNYQKHYLRISKLMNLIKINLSK